MRQKECSCSKIYEKILYDERFSKFDRSLPIDDFGVCLFHSDDIEWKIKYNFNSRFFEFVEIINLIDDEKYDFSEFIFIDSDRGTFRIDGLNINSSVDFSGAEFRSKVVFKDFQAKNVEFYKSIFRKQAFFVNCNTMIIKFDHAVMYDLFVMNNCKLDGLISFKYTIFKQLAEFIDVKFNDLTEFNHTTFSYKVVDEYDEPSTKFNNVIFQEEVRFHKTNFDCSLEFSGSTFNSNSEFIDVDFSPEWITDFSEIIVNKTLELKGIDKKLFRALVSFRIEEEKIHGQILFNNVNFYYIYGAHKDLLIRLSRINKVVIGENCIKYRHQTEPKTFYSKNKIQRLVIELERTFTKYFIDHNGINLGFEIIERTDEKVSFFFFSDENISDEEFRNKLEKTNSVMGDYLFNPELIINSIEENEGSEKKNSEKGLYLKELYTDLAAFNIKIKLNLEHGTISQKDILKLLSASMINSEKVHIDINNYINNTINKYSQNQLLSINSKQSIKKD